MQSSLYISHTYIFTHAHNYLLKKLILFSGKTGKFREYIKNLEGVIINEQYSFDCHKHFNTFSDWHS